MAETRRVLPRLTPILDSLNELNLQFSVGRSIVPQFAVGHDPADVLEELVQNEYDAEGNTLEVHFGTDLLTITGNGKVIDEAGWTRLSVMLGTGEVAGGDGRVVVPKENGIGSKNFGLRSLFLYGDQIVIASGGYQTVLDVARGSPPKPLPHAPSKNSKGVVIQVPFRVHRSVDGLETFTQEREAAGLDRTVRELPHLLTKLAQPGDRRSLKHVAVTSVRSGRALSWRQAAKRLTTRARGVTAVRRVIEIRDVLLGKAPSQQSVTELEFQKVLTIPRELRAPAIPGYFKISRRRIRIGISVGLRRGKLDITGGGIFFYPLGMRAAPTGNSVSVSAPFLLDADRSQIIDSTNSAWNKWLLERAAQFALDLVVSDWFDRFGSVAYLLFQQRNAPHVADFFETIERGLRERRCWASREIHRGRPTFVKANDLALPIREELYGFLDSRCYIYAGARDEVLDLARSHGAKAFTLNSLVRLRCAPRDRSSLETTLADHEADYYEEDFEKALADEKRQLQFTRALDAAHRHLTHSNRRDIAETPTTLTASGKLAAPSAPLWWVDGRIKRPPLSRDDQLHPILTSSRTMRRVCTEFDASKWAMDVAERASIGMESHHDRLALYQFLISPRTRLSRKANAKLRRAPVLLDHRGDWVCPQDISWPNARYADLLGSILHLPHSDYISNQVLGKTLGFRKRVRGEDVIAFAEAIVEDPSEAANFERVLDEVTALLTPRVVRRLKNIPFLQTSQGTLAEPSSVHIRGPLTLGSLGPEGIYPAGNRVRLYRKLGCLPVPTSEAIVDYLGALRSLNNAPPKPEVLYDVLNDALKRERATGSLAADSVLWTGATYTAPDQTLVGRLYAKTFFDSVPIFSGSAGLMRAYELLGASRHPQANHWQALLAWIGKTFVGQTLARSYRDALIQAYSSLGSDGATVSSSIPCLLDRHGQLHSISEARRGLHLVDDDPFLAEQVEKASSKITFAVINTDPNVRRFYASVGVKSITDMRRVEGVKFGDEVPAPGWLNVSELLSRIRKPLFAAAVEALITQELYQTDSRQLGLIADFRRRVGRITAIDFRKDRQISYSVSGIKTRVPLPFHVKETTLSLKPPRSHSDLYDTVAQALASLVSPDIDYSRRLTDALNLLVRCERDSEIVSYVKKRGIPFDLVGVSDVTDDGLDHHDSQSDGMGDIAERLTSDLVRNSASERQDVQSTTRTKPRSELGSPTSPLALPPIDTVVPRELETTDWRPLETPHSSRGGGGDGSWMPRTPEEQERDRLVGRRAEELILREERKRVAARGYPDGRVVWTSENDPNADHDIRSVDDDGEDLWIEVKATLGRSGNFQWSLAEFKRALKERSRYVLVRVYDAATTEPPFKRFRDPISLYREGEIRLNISSLSGQVEPA
jgi:hypothetical protein